MLDLAAFFRQVPFYPIIRFLKNNKSFVVSFRKVFVEYRQF